MSWIECLFDDECILYNKDHFDLTSTGIVKATPSPKKRRLGLFGSPELYRENTIEKTPTKTKNNTSNKDKVVSEANEEIEKKNKVKKVENKKKTKVVTKKRSDINKIQSSSEEIKGKNQKNTARVKSNKSKQQLISKNKKTSSTKTKISKFKASRNKIPIRNKTELSLMKCLFSNKDSSSKKEKKMTSSTSSDETQINMKNNKNIEQLLQEKAIAKRKIENDEENKIDNDTRKKKKKTSNQKMSKETNNASSNNNNDVKAPLLSKEDEIELSKLIQNGIKLQAIKSQYENEHDQKITNDEWAKLSNIDSAECLEEQLNESADAKNKLITSNLGLVYATIKNGNYGRSSGVSQEELVQEGCLGLIRAAELFDPSKGYRFSTYATIWIKGTLGNSRIDQTIAIPDREKRKWNKIQKAVQQISPTLHNFDFITKIENVQVISEMVDMSIDDVETVTRQMNNMKRILSLDYKYSTTTRSGSTTTTSDGDFSLQHRRITQSSSSSSDNDNLSNNINQIVYDLRHDVLKALSNTLSDREEQILRLRYGLNENDTKGCRSIVECAQEMGLSRARVQQLAASSLKKLREKEDVMLLQEYLADI